MSSPRDDIMAAIHRALGPERAERRGAACRRVSQSPRNLIPARARVPELVPLFEEMAVGAAASVERIATMPDVPAAARRFLASQGLPANAVLADNLPALDWAAAGFDVRTGAPSPEDAASITGSIAGIAESGTVMVASGAGHPHTLNLTVAAHVVVLRASDIVGPLEDAWKRLEGAMPRTVLWITGPSRTADVGQRILFGAHGPRALHILIVESD